MVEWNGGMEYNSEMCSKDTAHVVGQRVTVEVMRINY